jgi:hypothetical protein
MLIEVQTYRPRAGVDEAAFTEADREVQAAFNCLPGIMRRTTARAEDGEWLTVVLWWSSEEADAGAAHPAAEAFADVMEQGTLMVRRYTDIGG